MSFARLKELRHGIAMIVTDLHGQGQVYDHLKAKFLSGYKAGTIQHFIICGDLIHGNTTVDQDHSVRMLADVMQFQRDLGDDVVIMLMGNHEMPHIYGQPLAKGSMEFTARFEQMLRAAIQSGTFPFTRAQVHTFLADLPFFIATKAGVLITHAGPTKAVITPEVVQHLLNFDHNVFIQQIDSQLAKYDLEHARNLYAQRAGMPYQDLTKHYLAVTTSDDPRYDQLLRMFILEDKDDYQLLWDTFFSRNEQEYPHDLRRAIYYSAVVKTFLEAFSHELPMLPSRVVLSGHITARDGYQIVDDFHFRLASYEHAQPQSSGKYLLLDCGQSVKDADELVSMLHHTLD